MYDNDELLMLLDDDLFPVDKEEGDDHKWHGCITSQTQSDRVR